MEVGEDSCKIHDHNVRVCNSKLPAEAPVFFENKSKTALTLDNSMFLKLFTTGIGKIFALWVPQSGSAGGRKHGTFLSVAQKRTISPY